MVIEWIDVFEENKIYDAEYDEGAIYNVPLDLKHEYQYDIFMDELHNRFELGNSHLKHDELFKRAIIDEWFSFFRSVLILNNFKISNKRFSFSVSHDVDIVSKYKAVPLSRLILVILLIL